MPRAEPEIPKIRVAILKLGLKCAKLGLQRIQMTIPRMRLAMPQVSRFAMPKSGLKYPTIINEMPKNLKYPQL